MPPHFQNHRVHRTKSFSQRLWPAVWALLGIAVLAGCGKQVLFRADIAGLPGDYDPSRPLAVDVQNNRGTVLVLADPSVRSPVVKVRRGDRGELPRRDQGTDIRGYVAASYAEENGRGTLRVVGLSRDGAEPDPWARITIIAPNVTGLRVINAGGVVEVEGVKGAIEVQNRGLSDGQAPIRLRTAHPITEPVLLAATRGGVEARIGPASTGEVEAVSVGGTATVEADAGTAIGSNATSTMWRGTINGGQNPIVLRAEGGSVVLRVRE